MSEARTTRPARRVATRLAAAALGAGILVGTFAGAASAKEIGSGGATGGTTTTTCNPVTSLGYKGDATTSDTGFATITVNYGVKPCVKGQTVVVDTKVYESANPSVVVYDNPAAPLSGKFTVGGVKVSFSYKVTVTVTDANTGAVVGSQTIFAAAVRKTGV